MEINGLNPVITQIPQYQPAAEPEPLDEQLPPPAAEETETVEQDEGDGSAGVLRLLMDGHFKGVADVRLRINFQEELAALQNQQMTASAPEKIYALVGAVDGVLGTLPPPIEGGEQPVETLEVEEESGISQIQQAFADAVNSAKDEFVNSQTPSQETLVSGLQSAFAALVESLHDLFAPPTETTEELIEPLEPEPELLLGEIENSEPEIEGTGESQDSQEVPPTELTGDVETFEEPVFDLEAFLGELTAAFDTALADLIDTLNGTIVLPPLSEPSGSGKAYDKFLAIYNNIYGTGTGGEELNEIEPAETSE